MCKIATFATSWKWDFMICDVDFSANAIIATPMLWLFKKIVDFPFIFQESLDNGAMNDDKWYDSTVIKLLY